MNRILLLVGLAIISFGCYKPYSMSIDAHRAVYKSDFLKEEYSPFYGKEAELDNLRFYKAKKKFRVIADFALTPDEEPFEMATYSGVVKPYRKYGVAKFELNDKQHSLAIYQSIALIRVPGYRDYLFLPFKDLTNGETTYGGGRYMNLKIGDIQNDKIILDFNKNYNPYCAFADGYSCPIPPVENHLEAAIEAGEKLYAGDH